MSQTTPTLVFLHGYLGTPRLWEPWAAAVHPEFTVWSPALPGHAGRAALSEVQSMEALADWVLEGFQREHPGAIPHWIGHSMGGYIALAILERFPARVRSLTLINSSPFADSEERKMLRLRAMDAARAHREHYVRTTVRGLFDPECAIARPEAVDRATTWGLEASLEGILGSLEGMRLRSDRSGLLRESGKPVLLLHGQADPVIGPEIRASIDQLSSQFQSTTLPHGHMGPLEAGPQGLEHLRTFLRTV